MDEARRCGKAAARMLLALLLALMLVPVVQRDALAADDGAADGGAGDVAALLAAGQYVEGEALVVMDNTVEANGLRSRGVDLLASAEPLLSASGEAYATATGKQLPLQDTASDGTALLRSANALPADDAVSVVLVKQEGSSTEDLLNQLQDDPRVLSVEPNYVYTVGDPEREASEARMAAVASELGLGSLGVQDAAGEGGSASAKGADLSSFQWGCSNDGNTMVDLGSGSGSLDNFDINPPNWNQKGVKNADGVVAVVDTGVDYGHPDLAGVMCDMSAYTAQGGQYLSRGGQYGFNALSGADSTNPMDDHSHGTHCAGIIASEWNDVGTSGVASGVKVVAVKSGSAEGRFVTSDTVAGYEYLAEAVDAGLPLKAINNSWGGPTMGTVFGLAVTKLGQKGAVSLVAAGNESTDLDKNPSTATMLVGNPYAVVVDASTSAGKLASFSNYGVETTDVVAPGESILSTMPRSMSAYLPEADYHPVTYDTFDSSASGEPSVQAYPIDAQGEPVVDPGSAIGEMASGESRYDAVGGSLKVPVSDMAPKKMAPGMDAKCAVVSIPVGADAGKQESVRYVGMHLLTSPHKGDAVFAQFRITKADGTLSWTPFGVSYAECSSGWGSLSADMQKLVEASGEGSALAYTSEGELQVLLTLVRVGAVFGDNDALYLDSVGVGTNGSEAAYGMMSGTSMATPMVSGAAMVLAASNGGEIDPSAPAADRAAALAALVKASVRPAGGSQDFTSLCTSGGQIDLDPALSALTPVVSDARVEAGGSPTTIVIEGSYFGKIQGNGSVTVGGLPAKVVSWSDDSLTVECPQGAKSGVLMVQVTSDNGRSGKRGFLLELPPDAGDSATPLYEKTVSLPSPEEGLSAGITSSVLAGLGGSLYMLPVDASVATDSFSDLWRYNPANDTWTRCADLPEALDDNASLAVYEGKLYVFGEKGEDADLSLRLFSYDPAANTWQTHPAGSLPAHATLVNCADELLLVGGATYTEGAGGAKGRWVEKTEGNIAVLNPETGETTVAGTLVSARVTPAVAVRGSELYVTQGSTYDSAGAAVPNTKLERVTKVDGTYVGEDLTSALPELAPGYAKLFSVAAVKDGVVVAGLSSLAASMPAAQAGDAAAADAGVSDGALADEDTYLLDVADGSTAFQGFGKRASRALLYYPTSVAYDGWLYTMGFSEYEKDGRVMRATAVETLPTAGDVAPAPTPVPEPTPEPAPDGGSALVKTGDALGAGIAALAGIAVAAAVGAGAAMRRKARESR